MGKIDISLKPLSALAEPRVITQPSEAQAKQQAEISAQFKRAIDEFNRRWHSGDYSTYFEFEEMKISVGSIGV